MTGSGISSIDALQDRLGYRFRDPALLRRALTHASVGAGSNERLEFLGDRVLGLVVAEKLYADFPDEAEGGLHARHKTLVRRDACAAVARAIDLGSHLILAPSETASGRTNAAILAGACEALIAALYFDGGFEAARTFVLGAWADAFATLPPELRDAKTALQEWAQSGALAAKVQPVYTVVGRTGPDHAPCFTVEVSVPGHAPEAGEGTSKRDAEQNAAARMLARLGGGKA